MKRFLICLLTTSIAIFDIITFSGCEKENIKSTYQIIKTTGENDRPKKVVTELHKTGGTPISFLGITIGVRYGHVEKVFCSTVEIDGLKIDRYTIYCENEGNKRCRIDGQSYSTGSQTDDGWMGIGYGFFVSSIDMYTIMDNLIDSVDVQLLQVGRFSGSMSKIELLHTIDEATIPIHFDVIWENGNSDGDADINITAYYDTEN